MEPTELDQAIAAFLNWEHASRDTIDFKKVYVDAAGDLITGLVLSQIIYWHLPGHDGVTKLRVSHDGELWIAKTRDEWFDEIRVTGRQLDRALDILEGTREPRLDQPPMIATALYKFDGAPTKHIRLVWANTLEIVTSSILPKGQNPFYPNVKMDLPQTSKSITETTTETTAKTPILAPKVATAARSMPKPETTAQPRTRTLKDEVFDLIKDRNFDGVQSGTLIAMCRNALFEVYPDVTPDEYVDFCEKYRGMLPNASLPRNRDKLVSWFGTYRKNWKGQQSVDDEIEDSLMSNERNL